MTSQLVQSSEVQALLDRVAGLDRPGGDLRTKLILRRVVSDLFTAMDEFDVTQEEFWRTLHFLQQSAGEFGLISPGLGFDRFLDIRTDLSDDTNTSGHVTPRTIEGPLYVPDAPLAQSETRLDDGTDQGNVLLMHGRVLDSSGRPVAGGIVDVWHANTRGAYSHFDTTQSPYNNRRRIKTDPSGKYQFRSVVPSGYAVPAGGATEHLMSLVGRHGRRPAHLHFFISAPGHRHLTTQVNIDEDTYLHDDFAFATRDGLISKMSLIKDPARIRTAGLTSPFYEIDFDFVLAKAITDEDSRLPSRPRAAPPA